MFLRFAQLDIFLWCLGEDVFSHVYPLSFEIVCGTGLINRAGLTCRCLECFVCDGKRMAWALDGMSMSLLSHNEC